MKKVILDTNAYAGFFTGDVAVLDVLASAEVVYFSAVVLGELFAGFKGGSREAANKKQLEAFLKKSTVQVLDITQETAGLFGEIKHKLKKSGLPVPINDVWVAAQAVETGAVLITYDEHFIRVPGLRVWDRLKKF